MLAYLMLFSALSNAVCLHNAFFAIYFCKCFVFILYLGLLTQFVYFKYDFPSYAVLLICWFFLILCSHHFLYERAMCSGEIALKNNNYIIIIASSVCDFIANDIINRTITTFR